jgi:hypothetical protein
MKKYILFIFLFITIKSFSQSPNDLKKYSYLLYTLYKDRFTANGTAFFFERDQQTFIVTSYHVLSGIGGFDGVKNCNVDNLVVIYPTVSGKTGTTHLDLNQYQGMLSKPKSIVNEIDLFGVSILNIPANAKIYPINKLIDMTLFNKKPLQVFTFGYPGSKIKYQDDKSIFKQNPILIRGKFLSYADWLKKRYDLKKVNTDTLKKMNDKYFFIDTESFGGMSGSPVFGEFLVSQKGKKIKVVRFIGVLLGYEKSTKKTWVTNGKTVYDYLMGRTH